MIFNINFLKLILKILTFNDNYFNISSKIDVEIPPEPM